MLVIGEQDFIAADLLDVTEGDDVGTMTLEKFIRRQLRERFLQDVYKRQDWQVLMTDRKQYR